MATYTTNYNLKKPALADKIRIADFNGNSDTIDGAMHDNAVLGAQLKSDIGIVENTNTATHNISAGQYVIWKGDLYTASDAISSGATLSNANLTAVTGGGLNALNSNITANYVKMTKYEDYLGASGSKTYTLSSNTQIAFVIVNNGNGTNAVWVIGFRSDTEIGITQLSSGASYTTITTSGMTFTVACTYAARVTVLVY